MQLAITLVCSCYHCCQLAELCGLLHCAKEQSSRSQIYPLLSLEVKSTISKCINSPCIIMCIICIIFKQGVQEIICDTAMIYIYATNNNRSYHTSNGRSFVM